jgi:hypothetical protein
MAVMCALLASRGRSPACGVKSVAPLPTSPRRTALLEEAAGAHPQEYASARIARGSSELEVVV